MPTPLILALLSDRGHVVSSCVVCRIVGAGFYHSVVHRQRQGTYMSLLFDVFVAISNARLALLVKDIELTWTNLVAIFAGIPGMVSKTAISCEAVFLLMRCDCCLPSGCIFL